MKPKHLLHNACKNVRVTPSVLNSIKRDTSESSKTLSGLLTEKIRTSFNILFREAKEEEDKW